MPNFTGPTPTTQLSSAKNGYSRPPASQHLRSRTLSVISTSSAASFASQSAVALGSRQPALPAPEHKKLNAWGSFVPLNSASLSLRNLVGDGASPYFGDESGTRPLLEKSPTSCDDLDSGRSPSPPYITRSLRPLSNHRSHSPHSSSSSISDVSLDDSKPSDLHPVLARLERESRFCNQKLVCSTCRKPGRDFPQCGKCKKMWCSRECRLVGGKRHICN